MAQAVRPDSEEIAETEGPARRGGPLPGAALVAGLLLLVAGAASAADLVTGGSFDDSTDLSAWNGFGGPASVVAWDAALDVTGTPGSGSLYIEVDPSDVGNTVSPWQCIDDVVEGGSYDVSAFVFRPSSNPSPSSFLRIMWWSEPGCTGTNLSTADGTGLVHTGVWRERSALDVPAPVGAQSVQLRLTNFEDPEGTAVAYWDDVTFVPEPAAGAGALAALLTLAALRARAVR